MAAKPTKPKSATTTMKSAPATPPMKTTKTTTAPKAKGKKGC